MPKLVHKRPAYNHHVKSNRGRVCIAGKYHYLPGAYGSCLESGGLLGTDSSPRDRAILPSGIRRSVRRDEDPGEQSGDLGWRLAS